MVAVYHVFAGRVSGGVDVFLTLSGFFLLLSLTSRGSRLTDGRLLTAVRATGQAWLRIAKRLLPAAVVTLAGILVATAAFLPRPQWEETARQALASLFYVENWRLVANENDYEAAGLAVSPMQHFWSLSVQGQLFLVLPVAVLLLVWVSSRLRPGRDFSRSVLVAVSLAAIASFAYAIVSVQRDQPVAYYDTLARGWQILAGGLVALGLPRVTRWAAAVPEVVRAVVGLGALAAIVACGFLLDGGSLFPGWAAWWPVGATLLLIWAGSEPTRFGADRILGARPPRFLGDHAYALYLWHWPLLIILVEHRGRAEVSLLDGAAVLLGSLALAVVTKRYVEDPMRQLPARKSRASASRPARRRTAVALTATVLGSVVTVGGAQAYIQDVERLQAAMDNEALYASPDHVGALAMTRPGVEARLGDAEVRPPPHLVRDDKPEELEQEGCILEGELEDPDPCVIHQEDEGPVVALVGGSHAYQFLPAFRQVAEKRGFTLVGYLSMGCPWGGAWLPEERSFGGDPLGCLPYSDRLTDVLIAEHPDLVISTATRSVEPFGSGGDRLPPSYRRVWEEATDAGLELMLLRHNPGLPTNPVDCVEEHLDEGTAAANAACGVARDSVLTEPAPKPSLPGAHWVDMSDLYCRPTYCNVIEGNVMIYRSRDHISVTYARTMIPEFDRHIGGVTGWWNKAR